MLPRNGISGSIAMYQGGEGQATACSGRMGSETMRVESGSSIARPRPIDIYLGFEIVQDAEDRFVAIPRAWAGDHAQELEAQDLPTLRKLVWDWWFNVPN